MGCGLICRAPESQTVRYRGVALPNPQPPHLGQGLLAPTCGHRPQRLVLYTTSLHPIERALRCLPKGCVEAPEVSQHLRILRGHLQHGVHSLPPPQGGFISFSFLGLWFSPTCHPLSAGPAQDGLGEQRTQLGKDLFEGMWY